MSSWPVAPKLDKNCEQIGNIITVIIGAIRKKKSKAKLSMKAPVKRLVIQTKIDLKSALGDLKAAACAELIEFGTASEELSKDLKIAIEL